MSGGRGAGVCWDSSDKKWRAYIRADTSDCKSKQWKLGLFLNEVDAALAYDQAAREHHRGEAKLNFPDLPPQPRVAVNETPRHPTSQYRGKGRCEIGPRA
jgi:hypothetical protein